MTSYRIIAFVIAACVVAFMARMIWSQKEENATLRQQLVQSVQAGRMCSDSIAALAEEAGKTKAANELAIAAAKAKASQYKNKADKILRTPPSAPGNDCKSAAERLDGWLSERVK